MSPDQAMQALRSPLLSGPGVFVAGELADLAAVGRGLDPVERALERGVRDLARVVAVREHHEAERVPEAVEEP